MKLLEKALLGLVLLGAVAGALTVAFVVRQKSAPAEAFAFGSGRDALEPLWPVPPFSYLDQDGHRATDQELRGHVWIASFLFTTCTTACPLLTAQLAMLQRQIADPDVRFVSFSVDPEHDAPDVLKAYRARWTGDPRWTLLNPGAGLASLAQAMKISAARTGPGEQDVIHSSVFELVDAQGQVRAVYDSTDRAALQRLVADVGRLSSAPTKAGPLAGVPDGRRLFSALGCAGCHEGGRVGPDLGGLYGRTVMLKDGTSLTADAAYVRESIVAPAAKLVAGYPGAMPSYAGSVSEAELAALVRHVQSLPARADRIAPQTAIDPVCGMQVLVSADTPRAEHEGHPVWFCSRQCQRSFLESERGRAAVEKPR